MNGKRLRTTHVNGVTKPVTLHFQNNSTELSVRILWITHAGDEREYGVAAPGVTFPQQTYNTHAWILRDASTGKVLGQYVGEEAVISIAQDGRVSSEAGSWSLGRVPDVIHAQWGRYRERGRVHGMKIKAFDCVDERAVEVAAHTVSCMVRNTPPDILQRMAQNHASLAIIARCQATTDIPEHGFLRRRERPRAGGEAPPRDVDGTTRGLGGNKAVPTCSVGEENVLMEGDVRYPQESILVHEFAHSVMDLGMSEQQRAAVCIAYEQAKQHRMYPTECYMMTNAEEYWAEGCQSWFDATVRCDVNGGVNTRDKMLCHDILLASIMEHTFGHNDWRYPDTSPKPFGSSARRHAPAAVGAFQRWSGRALPRDAPATPVLTRRRASEAPQLPSVLRHSLCFFGACFPAARRKRASRPGSRSLPGAP